MEIIPKPLPLAIVALVATLAGCNGSTVITDASAPSDVRVVPDVPIDTWDGLIDANDADDVVDVVDVPDAGATHTYTFVVDQITIDATDDPSLPHTGFNLDGLFSGSNEMNGCFHDDYFSSTDIDQNCGAASLTDGMCPTPGCVGGESGCQGGVDNQFPTLANTIHAAANADIRVLLAQAVANNQMVVILRVMGITDDLNSPRVTVEVYQGFPTFTTDCTSGVHPNREYSVARGSITAGGTTVDDAVSTFPARIVNGRLAATAAAGTLFPFVLPPVAGGTFSFPLHAVQIRADLSSSALANGGLGGWVTATDVIAAVTPIAPSYAAVVPSLIGGMVDIEVANVCDDESDTPHVYGGISLGIGIHAVPAIISSTVPIATSATPGTCGH